ncbi:hypothetical protein GCM10027052_10590 [Parafrigoribacterium mesophilum]|uniref:hypothetical protein n=1 Tax=Parafrigoribacterium mesophilum TaxID=433646 RepID=UPI0031FD7F4C
MTAWQDEPPLTRRQMRMREREGLLEAPAPDEVPNAASGEEHTAPVVSVPSEPSDSQTARTPRHPASGTAIFAAATAAPVEAHQLTRRELRALRSRSEAVEGSVPVVQHELRDEVRQQAEPEPLPVQAVSPDFAEIIASPSIDTTAIPVIPPFPVPDREAQAAASVAAAEHTAGGVHPGSAEQTYTPPFGHWSMQAKIDDENQTLDHTIRRDLSSSSGAITTSALVLPSIPQAGDITRPISNTGEILITGSVELPSSLGSTGSYPTHFDRSDVDAIIAADDREDSAAGSAPVRAIRAVSTNNDTPALLGETTATESRTPFVLAIIAGSTLVVAVGLVIAGFIFNVF